jgi:hypothetical protein
MLTVDQGRLSTPCGHTRDEEKRSFEQSSLLPGTGLYSTSPYRPQSDKERKSNRHRCHGNCDRHDETV